MPRQKAAETDVILRLRYGIHTIVLLVSPMTTFDEISVELLEALRERYPRGLTSAMGADNDTPIPAAPEELEVRYAMAPKGRDAAAAGSWRDLNIAGTETPVSKGLRDSADLAFVFHGPDEEAPDFVVEWPALEEEE